MKILDGKKLAGEVTERLKNEVVKLRQNGIVPKLIIFQVGNNPASNVYVRMKQKKAEEIGAICRVEKLDESAGEEKLCELITKFNSDEEVKGIIVQLPLPDGWDKNRIINMIDEKKDVDGLTDANQIKILNGDLSGLKPATPKGIVSILDKYEIPIAGARVVVVGRSRLVGKTVALMLLNRNATVTICHSKTDDLKSVTREADILISAVGVPKLITVKHVKSGAIVVDVGISQETDTGMVGDVDFEAVKDVAGMISPVPGGVGPMTVVCLFENLIDSCQN